MEGLQNDQINLGYAQMGLYRRLDDENRSAFLKAGHDAYSPTKTTELDPMHHPLYRLGLAQKAIEQISAEMAVLDKKAETDGTN